MKKLCSALLAAVLCFAVGWQLDAQAYTSPVVRVGILYGGTAAPGANLKNSVGTGYRFGYMDTAGTFIQLGYTNTISISMVKNRNVYFDSSAGNYMDSGSGAMVGAYHVDVGTQFSDATSALQAAQNYQAAGHNAFPYYANGVFGVRIGSHANQAAAANAAASIGGSAATGSAYCISVVETGTGTILFQFDAGNTSTPFVVQPTLGEVQRPVTHCRGYAYAGAFEYCRRDGNDLTVVNLVDMEDYVKGVLPYEMNANWQIEALKAQALCARSYAYTNMNRHSSQGFHVCTSEHCQVYRGTNSSNANSDAAVDQTAGQYILYDNQPILAFFHSSDGGSTEDVINVWTTDYPYLRAVSDPYEDLSAATNGRWQYTLTNDQLTRIMQANGYSYGAVTNLTAEYTTAGNIYRLNIHFANGRTETFSKERARTILNTSQYGTFTWSQRYTVSSGGLHLALAGATSASTFSNADTLTILGPNGSTSTVSASTMLLSANGLTAVPQTNTGGSYLISGTGWGHNVGMSQNGAKAMAALGWTAQQIVSYYFTNVTIGYLP